MEQEREARVVVDTAEAPTPVRHEGSAPRRVRWIGWALIAAGAIALVSFTDPLDQIDIGGSIDTPAIEVPTSVAEAPEIVQRGGLSSPALMFERVTRVPGLAAVRSTEGVLLGLTETAEGRFVAVRSTDGVSWEWLPTLPEGAFPSDIWVHQGSVVVVGIERTSGSARHSSLLSDMGLGDPMVWALGADGWRAHPLPAASNMMYRPVRLVSLGDRLVVAAYRESSLRADVIESLPEEVAAIAALDSFYLDVSGDPGRAAIYFHGNQVWSATLDELGLPTVPIDDFGGMVTVVTDDFRSRSLADLGEEFYVDFERMALRSDGRLSAVRWAESGPQVVTSDDGLEWVEDDALPGSFDGLTTEWGDQRLAALGTSITRWDGECWRPITPIDLLPRTPNRDWQVTSLDVHDGVLVSVIQGADWSEPEEPEAVILRSIEGYRVEYLLRSGVMTVHTESDTHRVLLWGADPSAMQLDAEGMLVEIRRGGAVVARLSVEDLEGTQSPAPDLDRELRIVTTRDQRRWHMGAIEVDDAIWRWPPAVAFVVGGELRVIVWDAGDGGSAPGASVWTSTIP